LIGRARRVESVPLFESVLLFSSLRIAHVKHHCFEETIDGRVYRIEVTPVSNRWRAQLSRLPGMPTAMMPFYGTTPEEAAQLLARWLALAHARLTQAAVAGTTV
jgi:hypothetical protein